jgi:hypothetical protein
LFEISGVSFDQKDGVNIMKGYLESGEFSRGKESIRADGGVVMVGNFDVDVQHQQRVGHLFGPLPPDMRHRDLPLGEKGLRLEGEAKCSVMVTDKWRTEPPKARCLSRWSQELQRMKNRTEWHFNADGSLCYVLDAEWTDTLAGSEQTSVDEIAEVAAFFLTRNLRYLLSRQLVAYRNGFARWPAEWEQWRHGLLGRQAYQNQKARFQPR